MWARVKAAGDECCEHEEVRRDDCDMKKEVEGDRRPRSPRRGGYGGMGRGVAVGTSDS
jgi:hypothetical protein